MLSRLAPSVAFLLVSCALIWTFVHYAPLLPEHVATHFDASGRANGWATHRVLARDIAMLLGIFTVIFLGAGLLDKIPVGMINIRGKAHWLSEERRPSAVSFLRDWIRWFVVLNMALFALVIGLLLRANFQAPPHLRDKMFWLLGVYGVGVVAMLGALIWRFPGIPKKDAY